MQKLNLEIEIIGIDPFVSLPDEVLAMIFNEAGRDKGAIPIHGTINDKPYKQTLVKYSGAWRLYINTTMLKNSPKRIGETIEITVDFDTSDRAIKPHPKLEKALMENREAKQKFDGLQPSRKLEIIRYISFLKTEESVDRNIIKAINFLLGKERFVGREMP
jgi:hypothetical protein